MTISGERGGEVRGAPEKAKAVDAAILAIEKQFGRGSIMKLGSAERQAVDFIPTGSIALDLALGVGGLPRGRITEIFGPEMSGKTTLALNVIAQAQKQGGKAAFIDAEHAMDPEYAAKLGVKEKHIQLPETIAQDELIAKINACNADISIQGIIVQLPLPLGIDRDAVIEAIDPRKDVDGLTPVNVRRWMEGREDAILAATARGNPKIFE